MIALLPRDMKAALNANIGQTLQIPADLTINLDPPRIMMSGTIMELEMGMIIHGPSPYLLGSPCSWEPA